MDKQTEIHKLEAEKEKVDARLNDLKGRHFIKLGKRFGKRLFHRVHSQVKSHSFANWKKHYQVVDRKQDRTMRFEQGAHRDLMLRANNLQTRLR